MAKKKTRSTAKKQNQTSGRRKDKRKDSSTSTSTDFNNDLFIDVDNLNLNEEDKKFFRNLILSNSKASTNLQQQQQINKPKGLVNLGNTCYLNSVIQVLSQTPFLYELLNQRADKFVDWQAIQKDNHDKLSCKLGAPSILISCLVSLLRNLRSELKSSSSVIKPTNFVDVITSTFAQFKNYDQQDSHEFLRCLLDAIRINEISRQRKSILESMGIDGRKIKQLKDDKLNEAKGYSDSSNFTVIDSLFGGYCISSLKCEDCQYTSQIFEPFFDLSLPISEESDNYNNYHNSTQRKQQQRFNPKERKKSRTKVHHQNTSTKEGEEEDEEEQQIDAVDNNLLQLENTKNLNAKDRKLRRQLNKAAKRMSKKATKQTKKDLKEDSSDAFSGLNKNADEDKKIDITTQKIDDVDKKLNGNGNNQSLNVDKDYKKSSTLDEEEEDESDGESSDDEASSNEFSELKNDLSEEFSTTATTKNSENPSTSGRSKTVQSNNSVDSGINSSNLTSSEVDTNTPCTKIRNLAKSTISPVHEENTDTDCERNGIYSLNRDNHLTNQFKSEECIHNNSDKQSDTGFEDRNGEADSESEESNSANINDNVDDSDEEIEKLSTNQQLTFTLPDNDLVFNNENEEERKSVRSSAMNNDDLYKRKIKWTLSTVSNREETSVSCSILAGLSRFTKIELLVGVNKILCENCSSKFKAKNGVQKKIYTNGSRQMLIAYPPSILTLQLKRFELSNYRSMSLSKINKFVCFPLVFDLSPYVSNIYKIISSQTDESKGRDTKSIIYSLYGIIEHSGSLRSGHYKAYVKYNNKDSDQLKKFIRLQPYVPKVADLMDLITLNDIEKIEEDQQLNEILANMHLKDEQLDENLTNESMRSTSNVDPETTSKIGEEIMKAAEERWYHISDSMVSQVPLKTVLKSQAYLLFYERKS